MIHILLLTANDKKMLRALPVTHHRSKKSVVIIIPVDTILLTFICII